MGHRQFARFGLIVLYFSTFVLTTVPAQIFLVFSFLLKPRVSRKVFFYLSICAVYLFFVISINPSDIPLRNLLFYFSFVMPFLVMLSVRDSINNFAITNGFMAVICAVTVAEAILVNSPLGTNIWFLPAEHAHRVLFFDGLYQRPLGVAGIASSSGALIVFSLALSDMFQTKWRLFCKKNIVAILALALLASGTGFMLLVVYLITKFSCNIFGAKRMLSGTTIGLSFIIILLTMGASGGYFTTEGFNKFSFEYANLIIVNKELSLSLLQPTSLVELLLGGQVSQGNPVFATASDFGYLSMFGAIGVVGSMLVLGVPLLFARSLRFFVAPTIIFYLSFIHYPALSSPPGAVLFALYLYMLGSYKNEMRRHMETATEILLTKPCPERSKGGLLSARR